VLRATTWSAGATGEVTLNAVGDRIGGYNVLNLDPSSSELLVNVGSVSADGIVNVSRRAIVWPDGSTGTLAVPSSGDFSDEIPAGDNPKANKSLVAAAAVVGSVLGVVAIALVVSQVKLYRARHTPEDMDSIQRGLLEFGMGTTTNIGPRQLGFTLHLNRPVADLDPAALEAFSNTVLGVARGLNGLPKRIDAVLRSVDATVVATPSQSTVVLVMPKPRKCKLGSAEDCATVLYQHAMSSNFVLGDGYTVVDVSVTMSTRVPLEVLSPLSDSLLPVTPSYRSPVADPTAADRPPASHTAGNARRRQLWRGLSR
jgi:hypothetical protein